VPQGLSWPSLNQKVCAPRFFYGTTMGRNEMPERIAYARDPRKLPVILSADEVVRFLEAIPSLKTRAALKEKLKLNKNEPLIMGQEFLIDEDGDKQ
jgi:hypothetical protein